MIQQKSTGCMSQCFSTNILLGKMGRYNSPIVFQYQHNVSGYLHSKEQVCRQKTYLPQLKHNLQAMVGILPMCI